MVDEPKLAGGKTAAHYTLSVTDAKAAVGVQDHMQAILVADGVRRWIEPGLLPEELLVPYQAQEMRAWRVGEAATNSRVEPHSRMVEPISAT